MNAKPAVQNWVLLVGADGEHVLYFDTDRTEFSPIATHGRDRIFMMIHQGEMPPQVGAAAGTQGVVYAEVDAWRIGTRTIDKPRPRRRRRRSAIIIPFPDRGRRA